MPKCNIYCLTDVPTHLQKRFNFDYINSELATLLKYVPQRFV